MAKEKKDLGRTDVGKEGEMGKEHDIGKQGGEAGKIGGMPGEKKEWEKEKGGIGTTHEPGRGLGTPEKKEPA